MDGGGGGGKGGAERCDRKEVMTKLATERGASKGERARDGKEVFE